jgi:protein CpxP
MKKTLILLAALALTTAGTTFAQTTTTAPKKMKIKQEKPKQSPAQKADHGAAKMAKELGLNADQEARIEKILLARQQEMQAMKAKTGTGTDHKAMQPEMKAMKERYDAQFKEVLTAEQYTKYSQLKDEHKGHGGPGKMHGPRDGKMKMKVK